jgi:hypothetical protein
MLIIGGQGEAKVRRKLRGYLLEYLWRVDLGTGRNWRCNVSLY